MIQLSAHFSLEELVLSQNAVRHELDNTPSPECVAQLVRLCNLILEPLRAHLAAPVVISSGYRSPAVNALAGGVATSQHCQGRAADILVPGFTPLEVCRIVSSLALPFEQVIHEFGAWCHVSVALDSAEAKREPLTAYRQNGRVIYERGLFEVAT